MRHLAGLEHHLDGIAAGVRPAVGVRRDLDAQRTAQADQLQRQIWDTTMAAVKVNGDASIRL